MAAMTCSAVIRCHAEVRLLRNNNKVRKERLERQNLRVRLQCAHKFFVDFIRSRIGRARMVHQENKLLGEKERKVMPEHLGIEVLGGGTKKDLMAEE